MLIRYFTQPTWVLGLSLDIIGALIGLASLSILPISVAQPIFANGLVLLSLFSYFYLKEQLARIHWVGVVVCFCGTLLLAFTLQATDWSRVDLSAMLSRKLPIALVIVIVALPVLEFVQPSLEGLTSAREKQRGAAIVELCTGLQAGMCVGVGNAGIAGGLQALSHGAVGAEVAGAFGVVGTSVALVGLQTVFATRGYYYGRAVVITAYITLVSLSAGILMGLLVLDEPWPADIGMSLLRAFALVATILGVTMLNWKEKEQEADGEEATSGMLGHGALQSDEADVGKGGFAFAFPLPFKRDDVYKELISATNPLGADSDNLSLTMVSRAGKGGKGGTGGTGGKDGETVSKGCMRKAVFERPFRGHVLSELVELEAPSKLVWAQRESDCAVNFVGADGSPTDCKFVVELADKGAAGTEVRLAYRYDALALRGPLCVFAPVGPLLLRMTLRRSLPTQWAASMAKRGYQPLDVAAATKMQAQARGHQARKGVNEKKAIHGKGKGDAKARTTDAQRKRDQDEAAAIKAKAMGKATAAKK